MNWLHYLVEANVYLGVFYLCYCLFLNKETHYMLGRTYLLFSCVISFVLPVTQLGLLKPAEQTESQQVVLRQIDTLADKNITIAEALVYIYRAGAVITLIILCYRLLNLLILMRKQQALHANQYKLIQLEGSNTAFSFFNYLFIGTEVPQADTIIAHELVHIRQKHSADILFLELIKVISWFNPCIYLVQRSLRTIHEYIADERAAALGGSPLTYSSFLLNNAYGIHGAPIAHSFFNYNLLKKRIIMLNQKRSGRLARLKYLAAVPLCMGMLCASTLGFSKNYGFITLGYQKPATMTDTTKLPPPPPPMPPAKAKKAPNVAPKVMKINFPPPVVKLDEKLAPPPPPAPPKKSSKVAPKMMKVNFPPPVVKPAPHLAPPLPEAPEKVNKVSVSKIERPNVKAFTIVLDSPLVSMDKAKTATRIAVKNEVNTGVNIKLNPVIDNVKPVKAGVAKP